MGNTKGHDRGNDNECDGKGTKKKDNARGSTIKIGVGVAAVELNDARKVTDRALKLHHMFEVEPQSHRITRHHLAEFVERDAPIMICVRIGGIELNGLVVVRNRSLIITALCVRITAIVERLDITGIELQ